MESGLKIVSANVNTEPSSELAASSSPNSFSGGSSIAASSSHNSLPGGSFVEVNVDIVEVLSLPVSFLLVLLRTHCQASAHWFVYVKKTFLVHP